MSKWKKEDDPEYIGNMWGWKLSYVGLALLVLMLGLMAGRSCYLTSTGADLPARVEQPH